MNFKYEFFDIDNLSSTAPVYQVFLDEEYCIFPENMNAYLVDKYYYILPGPNSTIIMEPEKDFDRVLDKLWDPARAKYKANVRTLRNNAMLVTVEEGELKLPDRYLEHLNTNNEELFIYAYVVDEKIILSAGKIHRKNTFTLINEYGQEKEFRIVFMVQLDKSGADYIAYTDSINADTEHQPVKYARYDKNKFKLDRISSEELAKMEDIYKKICSEYKEHPTEHAKNIVVDWEDK